MNSLLTVATLGAAVAAINLTAQDPPVPVKVESRWYDRFQVTSPSCNDRVIFYSNGEFYRWDGDALNIDRWDDESGSLLPVVTFAAEDPNSIDCSIYKFWDF